MRDYIKSKSHNSFQEELKEKARIELEELEKVNWTYSVLSGLRIGSPSRKSNDECIPVPELMCDTFEKALVCAYGEINEIRAACGVSYGSCWVFEHPGRSPLLRLTISSPECFDQESIPLPPQMSTNKLFTGFKSNT